MPSFSIGPFRLDFYVFEGMKDNESGSIPRCITPASWRRGRSLTT